MRIRFRKTGEAWIPSENGLAGDAISFGGRSTYRFYGDASVSDTPADAPTVQINAIPVDLEGTTYTLSAVISGGTYDTLTYAWTVSGGALDDPSNSNPTLTRPQVSSDSDFTVDLTVTARGTGANARDGTSDTASATQVTFRVTNNALSDAVAPTVQINAIPVGVEGSEVQLSATLAGGTYDGTPTYAWTVSAGTLTGAATATPTWTRPQVGTAGQDVTITFQVTVGGSGTNARDGTTDSATATRMARVTEMLRLAVPIAITVPGLPLRTQPSEFSENVDDFLEFLKDQRTYMEDVHEIADRSAREAEDAEEASEFSELNLAQISGHVISVNDGVSQGGQRNSITSLLYALTNVSFVSRESALAGDIDNKAISPSINKVVLDELAPSVTGWQKIATKVANGSADIVFDESDFDADRYGDYFLVFRNLLPASEQQIRLHSSSDGGTTNNQCKYSGDASSGNSQYVPLSRNRAVGRSTDETGLSGILHVMNLHGDHGSPFSFRGTVVDSNGSVYRVKISGQLQRPSRNSPVNHLRIQAANGNTASGEVVLYGLLGPSEIPAPGFRTTQRTTNYSVGRSVSRSTTITTHYVTSWVSEYNTQGIIDNITRYRATSRTVSYTTRYTSFSRGSRTTEYLTYDQ